MRRFFLSVLFFYSLVSSALATNEEQALQAKLVQQLEAVLGPGNVKVTVTAKIIEGSQSRRVENSNPQAHSRSIIETRSEPGGSRRTQQENFVFDTSETLLTQPVKQAQRSVLVVYQPDLNPEKPGLQEQEIYDLVSAGMGFDAQQGDSLQVKMAYFDRQWQAKMQAELEKSRHQSPIWLWVSLVFGGAVIGVLLGYVFVRYRDKKRLMNQSSFEEYGAYQVTTSLESSLNLLLEKQTISQADINNSEL